MMASTSMDNVWMPLKGTSNDRRLKLLPDALLYADLVGEGFV